MVSKPLGQSSMMLPNLNFSPPEEVIIPPAIEDVEQVRKKGDEASRRPAVEEEAGA